MLKWLVLVSIKYNHPNCQSLSYLMYTGETEVNEREERKYTFMCKYINNYDNFFFNQKTQVKFKSMHRWIIFTFTIIKTPYSTMVLQLQLIDST